MVLGSICLISLFLISGAVYKPQFFWTSTPILALRRWLGDRKAENFIGTFGSSFFILGWVYYSPIKVWMCLVGVLIIVAASGFLVYRFNSTFKIKRKKPDRRLISSASLNPFHRRRKLFPTCEVCEKNPPY